MKIAKAIIGAAAAAAVPGMLFLGAGAAHADRTVTATQACDQIVPGTKPIQFGVFGTELACVFWGGPNVEYPLGGETLRQAMDRVYPGSFQVNPANPWSDWIIPG